MKIAIDGIRFTSRPSGISNITISIINALAQNFKDADIYVFTNGALHPEVKALLIDSEQIKICSKPLRILPGIKLLWSFFNLNKLVSALKPDYFIAPNFVVHPFFLSANIKTILFIHDLVVVKYPQTMEWINKVHIKSFLRSSLKRANLIWCNSAHTKQDLIWYYPKELINKQVFIGAGVNPQFVCIAKKLKPEAIKAVIHQFSIKGKYMVFVGTLEPRKNLEFLIKLFKHIYQEYTLVIVGMSGWGNEANRAFYLNKNSEAYKKIVFTQYISNQELAAIYKNAEFYICTSIDEGLGLPLLEAMICGCPVITAHNSAMVEVVEGAGVTVKGWEVNDWLNAIADVIPNRERIVARSYERVQHYNWNKIIKDFVGSLDNLN
jgi:glycosyltransferase involved in cell wall biosynthesis